MAILKAEFGVVAIRGQIGPVTINVDGQDTVNWIALSAEFDTGQVVLFAVRHSGTAEDVELRMENFCNQKLHNDADCVIVLTEKEITKPAVYRAQEMVRARELNNEKINSLVMEALQKAGGRVRVVYAHCLSMISRA